MFKVVEHDNQLQGGNDQPTLLSDQCTRRCAMKPHGAGRVSDWAMGRAFLRRGLNEA